jgi:hypothetical protein
MPRQLCISILLATLTVLTGCKKLTTTVSGKLTGFPSIAAAEDAIALANVKFEKKMPGEFSTANPGGAWSVHFKFDDHDALLQTTTTKGPGGTYQIVWTFTVFGSDANRNQQTAALMAKYIAETDTNRLSR